MLASFALEKSHEGRRLGKQIQTRRPLVIHIEGQFSPRKQNQQHRRPRRPSRPVVEQDEHRGGRQASDDSDAAQGIYPVDAVDRGRIRERSHDDQRGNDQRRDPRSVAQHGLEPNGNSNVNNSAIATQTYCSPRCPISGNASTAVEKTGKP